MKGFVLMQLMMPNAFGGRWSDLIPCPTSMAPFGEAVIRDLEGSLSSMDSGLRSDWCGQDSESSFLVVSESWDSDPTRRWTRAFAVCLHHGGDATWSRVDYFRRWPTALESSEHRRRVPRRFAKPHGVRVTSGPFPPSAIEDLRAWIDVVGIARLPTEFQSDSVVRGHLGVRVMRIRFEDGEKVIVGGEYCLRMPRSVNLLFEAMLTKPDPVAYLASKREEIRQRPDELRESPAP